MCGLGVRRTSAADLEKLGEKIERLDRDMQRQNDVLSDVCRKVKIF